VLYDAWANGWQENSSAAAIEIESIWTGDDQELLFN
jgi:hypothetical protein